MKNKSYRIGYTEDYFVNKNSYKKFEKNKRALNCACDEEECDECDNYYQCYAGSIDNPNDEDCSKYYKRSDRSNENN